MTLHTVGFFWVWFYCSHLFKPKIFTRISRPSCCFELLFISYSFSNFIFNTWMLPAPGANVAFVLLFHWSKQTVASRIMKIVVFIYNAVWC